MTSVLFRSGPTRRNVSRWGWLAMMAMALPWLLAARPAAALGVRCEVVVIHATAGKSTPFVDPALSLLADLLRKSFGGRFSSFRQLSAELLPLSLGQKKNVKLPNERELGLTLMRSEGRFLDVLMELQGLRTTVRIRDGGLFFQAGYAFQGGMLILAITVRRSG